MWDILGGEYYDVLGDDYYDVLGATMAQLAARGGGGRALAAARRASSPSRPGRTSSSRGRPGAGSALAQAAMAAAASRGAIVSNSPPSQSRELILPIDSGAVAIAAGANANIVAQPSTIFRPDRFAVDPVNAPSFLINNIQVGRASQFNGAGAVPATAFSAQAVGVGVKWDTLQISQQLQINVTNTSLGALRFTAAVFGTAIE